MLGQAKLALCFQIPSQASLHGIVNPHRPFCYTNGPAFCASRKMWKIEKNTGLRLVSKRGAVVKKHLQARLRVSFPQQIQHSHSESSPCFFCLPIRVYPSYPWLNAILTFAARITAVVRGNDSLPATRNPLLSFV